ncbi:MAG: DUF4388 domain-containing protein [Nannocystis sp.]|uniref:DUF4388 domain-containing protein n=1 Tax=Nannocystis sp. TaxID=1962667 RepID=UPI002422728F|nr:DUF4388 domain-containing protein [Nannocystis sp.]MBK9757293.1 DUF4388 domain-containing protein [Nannocystis sp.]
MATTIAQIGGFELWDILQLAQTSRMSIKLSVESPHGTGSMFFQGGNLLHAVAGGNEGDDAVNIILDWREGSVSSSQLPENCPTTVRHSSIVALLMDRARQRDEQQRDRPPPPQPSPPPPVQTPYTATPTSSAPKFTPPIVASRPLPAPPRPPVEAPVPSPPEFTPEPAPELPPDKELSDMDLRAVKVILEEIDEHLGGGLLSVDIISKASGMSLAGINSAPKACALFNRLSEQLHTALTKSEDSLARGINKFIIEGDNGLYIFVIELDERHRWAMLVDGARAQLGMVFVIIPEIQPRLVEAIQAR